MEELNQLCKKEDPDNVIDLGDLITSGAYGTVFKATLYSQKEVIIIKVIKNIDKMEEQEIIPLIKEVSLLKACKHPNIIHFLGAWKDEEYLYIGMEYCEGGSLDFIYTRLKRGFSEEALAQISIELFEALNYLHRNSIIHRDIKGGNIVLASSGHIKLVDFGSATKSSSERSSSFIGTGFWMAPEVIDNKSFYRAYGVEVDIWSTGITLIELAEAKVPLEERGLRNALMSISQDPPPTFTNPENWSNEIKNFLSNCLQKDPSKRHSAAQLLKDPFVANVKFNASLLLQSVELDNHLEQRIIVHPENNFSAPTTNTFLFVNENDSQNVKSKRDASPNRPENEEKEKEKRKKEKASKKEKGSKDPEKKKEKEKQKEREEGKKIQIEKNETETMENPTDGLKQTYLDQLPNKRKKVVLHETSEEENKELQHEDPPIHAPTLEERRKKRASLKLQVMELSNDDLPTFKINKEDEIINNSKQGTKLLQDIERAKNKLEKDQLNQLQKLHSKHETQTKLFSKEYQALWEKFLTKFEKQRKDNEDSETKKINVFIKNARKREESLESFQQQEKKMLQKKHDLDLKEIRKQLKKETQLKEKEFKEKEKGFKEKFEQHLKQIRSENASKSKEEIKSILALENTRFFNESQIRNLVFQQELELIQINREWKFNLSKLEEFLQLEKKQLEQTCDFNIHSIEDSEKEERFYFEISKKFEMGFLESKCQFEDNKLRDLHKLQIEQQTQKGNLTVAQFQEKSKMEYEHAFQKFNLINNIQITEPYNQEVKQLKKEQKNNPDLKNILHNKKLEYIRKLEHKKPGFEAEQTRIKTENENKMKEELDYFHTRLLQIQAKEREELKRTQENSARALLEELTQREEQIKVKYEARYVDCDAQKKLAELATVHEKEIMEKKFSIQIQEQELKNKHLLARRKIEFVQQMLSTQEQEVNLRKLKYELDQQAEAMKQKQKQELEEYEKKTSQTEKKPARTAQKILEDALPSPRSPHERRSSISGGPLRNRTNQSKHSDKHKANNGTDNYSTLPSAKRKEKFAKNSLLSSSTLALTNIKDSNESSNMNTDNSTTKGASLSSSVARRNSFSLSSKK